MADIRVDCGSPLGVIRPLHGVNNGPTGERRYERRSNFESFSELRLPFVRNHDASLSEAYGSQHVVDVHCIFSDFSRDPSDASAYDFQMTDEYTKTIIDAGSAVFYRLGASIENWSAKYGTRMPKDFSKWVDVCEHIVMHYTEGWANGFTYDITYWEIWNEPDLDPDDAIEKRTWGGTKAEFFDLYALAAKRLKSRFPHLKIGGPALAYNESWADEFLSELRKREVPIDFFSWHIYSTEPKKISAKAKRIEALLQKHGYGELESILNEWNYVDDWDRPLGFLKVVKGLKGASFDVAVMCEMQNETRTASMMYYDARVEKIWNGLFDSDTLLPLKGYYAFKAYGKLYHTDHALPISKDDDEIYAVAAASEDSVALLLTSYADRMPTDKDLEIFFDGLDGKWGSVETYLISETQDLELVSTHELKNESISLRLSPYQIALIVIRRP